MSERRIDTMLVIHMSEKRDHDGSLRGRCDAAVQGYAEPRQHDQAPTTSLSASACLWARFAMHALYGRLDLHAGGYYGFEWGYEPEYTLITVHDLQRVSTGLRKAEKAYDKLCTGYGRPQSLGQQVVYLMKALGLTRACWKLPTRYDSSPWRIVTTPEDIRYHIDHTIEACLYRQQHPEHAATPEERRDDLA